MSLNLPSGKSGRPRALTLASSREGVLRGIVAMLVSQVAFVTNDTFMKLATESLPMGEVIFIRGAFATLAVGIAGFFLKGHRDVRTIRDWRVTGRVVSDVLGMAFFVAALVHMPIANVTIILQATPLAVTAAAALFLGEHVGWRRWIAIGVGFAGVLVVVRPGLAGFEFHSILVLISVLFVTVRDVATRSLPASVSTWLITLATTAGGVVVGIALAPFEEWSMPSPGTTAELAAAGLLLAVGQATIIVAMRVGDMSLTASFRYWGVVIAIAYGYLIWGDVPDTFTLAGSAIIVATGIYAIYRERKLARPGRPLVTAPAAIDRGSGG
jgi:drug/metabolite transporter (DMT)-like permease